MGLFADTTVQITTAYIDMTNVNNTCPQGLTYTVKLSTRMCTCSHTGYTLTAPQLPFQHMEFPTLRSVEELEDTSTMLHLDSMATTILIPRLRWTAPMVQVCPWHS